MAKVTFEADQEAESTGDQGGGGNRKAKVRGVYTLQIVEVSDGKKTSAMAKKFPNVPMTNFKLEVATDDERDMLGEPCWHGVTWVPRGKDEKAAPGHGMAVHWLHATNMPFNGKFEFDEEDWYQPAHANVRALLEVEEYESKTKKPDGTPYINEKFVIRQVYTDAHPEPAELPAAPAKKAPQPARAGGKTPAPSQQELEEVPF